MTEEATDPPPANQGPKRSAKRMFAATVLLLEAFVTLFAALVAYGLRLADPGLILAVAGGLVLAAVIATGLLRYEFGYLLGWAVQVWLVATGLVLAAMYVIGGVFLLLWVIGLRLGGRIDRERAERANAR